MNSNNSTSLKLRLSCGLPVKASVFVFAVAGIAPGQRTPDEINTIQIFKQAAPAVVHVRSMYAHDKSGSGESTGSGFLIDNQGHVLTNFHVVQNAMEVKLLLSGGQTFSGILIGTAPAFDIALLKVDASEPVLSQLSSLPLGDSASVEVGQKVLAIGNPLGLHDTLTTGVVSGLARDLPGVPVGLGEALLQTDAAINPGNSGGPLLDSEGKVIGINSVVAAEGQNIGFAIPINFVKRILPELMTMGHAYRPDLGISLVALTSGLASLFGLPATSGLLVQEILPGGAAYQAGLRMGSRMVWIHETVYVLGGDLLVAANGKELHTPQDLTALLLGSRPGDEVRLDVLRGEARRTITLVLPAMHF